MSTIPSCLRRVENITQEQNTENVLLAAKEAAAFCDVTPGALSQMRHKHTGCPYLKIGGSIRYRLSDLIKWLQSCEHDPQKERGCAR